MIAILWFTIPAVGLIIYWYYRFLYKQSNQQIKYNPNPETWSDDEVTFTWVGHSTVYINMFGFKILTDPVFSKRVGVSLSKSFVIGPKRYTAPALSIEHVKNVDLILLSHAHLDHFDTPSLKALENTKTHVIVSKNTSHLLRKLKFASVQELNGSDVKLYENGIKVRSVPVRHWGARYPWNKHYGWTGYVIEHRNVRLFFAGDTAYTSTFKKLRKYGAIDTAFIPIGAYSNFFESKNHCTPEQAWKMFIDSGAEWLVPIHWNTFVLSMEPRMEPIHRLLRVAGSKHKRIVIREQGETFRTHVKNDKTENAIM